MYVVFVAFFFKGWDVVDFVSEVAWDFLYTVFRSDITCYQISSALVTAGSLVN